MRVGVLKGLSKSHWRQNSECNPGGMAENSPPILSVGRSSKHNHESRKGRKKDTFKLRPNITAADNFPRGIDVLLKKTDGIRDSGFGMKTIQELCWFSFAPNGA